MTKKSRKSSHLRSWNQQMYSIFTWKMTNYKNGWLLKLLYFNSFIANTHILLSWAIVAATSAALCSAALDSESQGWAQRSLSGPSWKHRKRKWLILVQTNVCFLFVCVCALLTGAVLVCSPLPPRVGLCPQRWCCSYSPSRLHPLKYPGLLHTESWALDGLSFPLERTD